jgi:ketosteroid isomerase-like protein
MQRILLFLAMGLILGVGFGLAGPDDDVIAAEKAWAEAVTSRDFDALDKLLSPELIYAHSTGVVETKDEYLAKLKSGDQRYDVIDHEKTIVKVHGDAAAAHSIVVMKGATRGEPFNNRLIMMHLWVRHGGSWQLAAHQTTRLAD